MWANDYGSREPRTVTDADRERIARAEAKRARKAAKRVRREPRAMPLV
jgi:hypothetical protein